MCAQKDCKILLAHGSLWYHLPNHPHCNFCSNPQGICRLLHSPPGVTIPTPCCCQDQHTQCCSSPLGSCCGEMPLCCCGSLSPVRSTAVRCCSLLLLGSLLLLLSLLGITALHGHWRSPPLAPLVVIHPLLRITMATAPHQ